MKLLLLLFLLCAGLITGCHTTTERTSTKNDIIKRESYRSGRRMGLKYVMTSDQLEPRDKLVVKKVLLLIDRFSSESSRYDAHTYAVKLKKLLRLTNLSESEYLYGEQLIDSIWTCIIADNYVNSETLPTVLFHYRRGMISAITEYGEWPLNCKVDPVVKCK